MKDPKHFDAATDTILYSLHSPESRQIRAMQPIQIKNSQGETIEIQWDDEGTIKIRHSDIDRETWSELHEHSKRMKQPGPRSALEKSGINPEDELAKQMAAKLGGYIVIDGKSFGIGAKEVALIHDAIKKAGGIIPNWSNCP
jgi:hypothetical protein